MKLAIRSIIFFVVIIFSLGSCTPVMYKIYGMKEIKEVDERTIIAYAKDSNIPFEDIFELDTSYTNFLLSIDTSLYKKQIKNHYQPLQALYFDKSRQLKSFQINCYAGGSTNLKWDRDSILTSFPPKEQAPLDNLVSLDTQLKYLRPLTKTTALDVNNYDYIVIVYWNRFMNRQSKRLVKFIQENCKLAKGVRVKTIYANDDNFFAKNLKN